MQLIQRTVLKTPVHPGYTPIFIIAPFVDTALDFATYLSLNIHAENAFGKLQGIINQDNNYFFNKQLEKVAVVDNRATEKKRQEQKDKIKLLIDEGMNNRKLWGLVCDYECFFSLRLDSIYNQASFFFVYDSTQYAQPHNAVKYLNSIKEFYNKRSEDSFIFYANQLSTIPELVIEQIPLTPTAKLNSPLSNITKHYTELTKEDINFNTIEAQSDPELYIYTQEIHNLNWLQQKACWWNGEELTSILVCNHEDKLTILLQKLEALNLAFVNQPYITIICSTEGIKTQIQQATEAINISAKYIVAPAASVLLNEVIKANSCKIIMIDLLECSYTLPSVLTPFKNNNLPAFSFAQIAQENASNNEHKITTADVLTTHVVSDNIIFSASIWQQLNGFDQELEITASLWDFSIRAIYGEGQFAHVARGYFPLHEHKTLNQQWTQTDAYKSVIEKQRSVFEDSLNQVIARVAQHHHLPLDEIKNLNKKIAGLQTLLLHSKDEYKALNKYSIELAERVQSLENRWYFKLGRKLKHYKSIFFRKNSTGKGTLKRLFEFLKFMFSKPGFRIVRKVIKGGLKKMYVIAEDRPIQIVYLDAPAGNHDIQTYNDWIRNKLLPEQLKETYKTQSLEWTINPTVSIVMPVYNPPAKFLKEAIESVRSQLYPNWELCIADDCSPNPQIKKMLNAYVAKDKRIKVTFRQTNGHISACSNTALQLATGEYILFMDHDDLLTENCISEVVAYINQHQELDIIYSDEDKVDENNFHSMPHFKSQWAPHSIMSRNYFGHVVVMKKEIVQRINGFREGFEGSQDYDLILRATEATKHIGHIPKVLYHWRIHSESAAQSEEVKPYAYIAAKKALEEAMTRRDTPGEVQYLSGLKGYRIRYGVQHFGKVSIIIPTKDQVKLLQNTIDSILELTDYPDYEIIILNNNSSSKEFFVLMNNYTNKHPDKFRCVDANFPFNFAKLMNIGVSLSNGEYILFLNNDVEVIHADWITQMVSYTQQEQTGVVGVKLLYPDDNIQHAGVIVGLGGVAGHAFVNLHKNDAGYFNYVQSVNNFSALTAACLMCRKATYLQVGGMDEAFEVEYNDVDLCLKFIKAGYYNVYLPDVELYHYESATRGHPHQSKESWERHIREIALFKTKWQDMIDNDPYYNPNLNRGTHDFSINFSA